MKKIKFNQPKYIYPLFALPLLFILFYVLKGEPRDGGNQIVVVEDELQPNLSGPSGSVSEGSLNDKVSEYKRYFSEGSDDTAIESLLEKELEEEEEDFMQSPVSYNQPVASPNTGYQPLSHYQPEQEKEDESRQALLDLLRSNQQETTPTEIEDEDPIEMMRQQFALLDSFNRTQDPDYKLQLKEEEEQRLLEEKRRELRESRLSVKKASTTSSVFNTIKKEEEEGFIKAIIDESLTVYAGSRVRIKLQEAIQVGDHQIEKGTYLYATVSGFSAQRINFTIHSIMEGGELLPVNLEIYDVDGLKGLYIPASAFREFTQELGSTTMQGVNLNSNNPENSAQFLMSSAQQAFTSTSQAISKAIRKNKANLKYSTFIYLIEKKN